MSLETQLLSDSSASFWLKEQVKETQSRDPIDALNDAELLVEVLKDRANTILNKGQ